jgi:hypothetical protein
MYLRIRTRRGSALIITLGVLLMLSLLSLTLVDTAQQDMNISFNQVNSEQAFYVAEAGAKRALTELALDTTWRTGFASETFEDGAYWVAVIDSTTQPALAETLLVRSTGRIDRASAQVEAWLTPVRAKSGSGMGVFGNLSVLASGGGSIDCYDSELGSYASQAINGPDPKHENMWADDCVMVGSNGEIKLTGGSTIHGDVITSPGGSFDLDGGYLYGDSSYSDTVFTLPPVDSADMAWAWANNSAPSGLSFLGSATYDVATRRLRAGGGATVTFTSGVYYFSEVEFSGGSMLEIAPGADVEIYCEGQWRMGGGGMLNSDGLPGNVRIFSTGERFEFSGGSGFWATVYAPNAEVKVSGGGDAYGSYVGNEIENSGGTTFHYDAALGRTSSGPIQRYKVIAWRQL